MITLASSPFWREGEMISIPLKILKLAYFIWARDGMYTYWSQKPMPERDCVVEHVAPTTQNHTLIKYIIIFISVTIYIMVRWIKTDIILTDGVRGNTFCKGKWVTGSSPVQSNIGNEFHTDNVGVGSRSCTTRGTIGNFCKRMVRKQICGEIQVLELIRFVEHNH